MVTMGGLVQRANASELADVLAQCLRDDRHASLLSARGRSEALAVHTLPRMIEDYQTLIRDIDNISDKP